MNLISIRHCVDYLVRPSFCCEFSLETPCRPTLQPLDLLVRTRLTTSPPPLWCDALSDCLPARVQCVPISSEAVYRVELCFSFISCLSSESGEDPKFYPAGLHRRSLTGTWCGRVTIIQEFLGTVLKTALLVICAAIVLSLLPPGALKPITSTTMVGRTG